MFRKEETSMSPTSTPSIMSRRVQHKWWSHLRVLNVHLQPLYSNEQDWDDPELDVLKWSKTAGTVET